MRFQPPHLSGLGGRGHTSPEPRRGKAKPLESWGSVQASLPLPPAGAARTPLAPLSGSANPKGKKAQKQPPSPSGTCQRTGSTFGHPPSGGGQCCSSLSSFLTRPPPNPPALLQRQAAPGSYRSEWRLQRQLSDQWSWRQRQKLCVWEWLVGRRP